MPLKNKTAEKAEDAHFGVLGLAQTQVRLHSRRRCGRVCIARKRRG